MMPSAVFEKVGTSEHGWFAPSVDSTVHLTGVPSGRAGSSTATVRVMRPDGDASAESALWHPQTR